MCDFFGKGHDVRRASSISTTSKIDYPLVCVVRPVVRQDGLIIIIYVHHIRQMCIEMHYAGSDERIPKNLAELLYRRLSQTATHAKCNTIACLTLTHKASIVWPNGARPLLSMIVVGRCQLHQKTFQAYAAALELTASKTVSIIKMSTAADVTQTLCDF